MKKRLLQILVVLVVGLAATMLYVRASLTPPDGPLPRYTSFSLDNVTLITPGLDRAEGQSLTVENGSIVRVGPAGSESPGPILEQYSGAFVTPGLVDLHTHFPGDTPLRLTQYLGIVYLLHGVTTVRDSGDLDGTGTPAAKRAFEIEGHAGPRIFSTGPFINGDNPRWANSIVVHTVEDVRAAVARIRAEGFDSRGLRYREIIRGPAGGACA